MIAEAQKGMEGFDSEKLDEVGETMMEDMMQQFEGLGEEDDYNEVILHLISIVSMPHFENHSANFFLSFFETYFLLSHVLISF